MKTNVTLKLDADLLREARVIAAEEGRSMSALLTDRLESLVRERKAFDRVRTFGGQWVILEGDELIASGPDPRGLVAEARARGIQVPYIFFVDRQPAGPQVRSRRRKLPVVKATGRPIVQAEIDDAFDD